MIAVPSSSQADEKVTKLKYSNFFPPSHKNSILSEQWGKEIEKRTNGRVKVTYFPGSILTPPTQTYDSVVKGIADIGQSLVGYSPGRFPLTEVLALPLGYSSGIQATNPEAGFQPVRGCRFCACDNDAGDGSGCNDAFIGKPDCWKR